MKFDTDIQSARRMEPKDFSNLLIFPLEASSGKKFV